MKHLLLLMLLITHFIVAMHTPCFTNITGLKQQLDDALMKEDPDAIVYAYSKYGMRMAMDEDFLNDHQCTIFRSYLAHPKLRNALDQHHKTAHTLIVQTFEQLKMAVENNDCGDETCFRGHNPKFPTSAHELKEKRLQKLEWLRQEKIEDYTQKYKN